MVTALRFAPFGGMIPAVDDTLLPDLAATLAQNTWLFNGKARGLPVPKLLRNCTDPAATRAFRIPNKYTDPVHIADATWLEFENPNTDVIRSMVVGDTFDRYYWASTSDLPRYNTLARIQAGDPAFKLGIPNPGVAPTVTPSGGTSGVTVSRAYVYTWVSAYGEEGPPSLPTVATGKEDDTWALTFSGAAAGDLGTDRNLTNTRIYRTVTGTDGTTTYFFVDEIPIATLTYNDTETDAAVSANAELESTDWSAPPSDLQGWVTMPNGMVAAWRDKEIWFCEPYRPHAWPAKYTLAVDYPIVGFGTSGQALVVCTQGAPAIIYGADPGSMSQSKVANIEPCMSRGSIISRIEGVYYASPNGLIAITGGQATNITQQAISKDKWQELVPIATLYAAQVGNSYYGFGSARPDVFETTAFETTVFEQQDFSGSYVGLLLANDPNVGFSTLYNDIPCWCVWNDAFTGEVLLLRDGAIYWLDFADNTQQQEVFIWKSKVFQMPERSNLGAVKVFFDVPASTPAQSSERNTDAVQTLADDQYGLIRFYADGRLVTTRELRTSGEPLRIASGFKADYWQFEIEARVEIKNVQVASVMRELTGV